MYNDPRFNPELVAERGALKPVRLLIVKTRRWATWCTPCRWWPTCCATTRAQIDWLVEPPSPPSRRCTPACAAGADRGLAQVARQAAQRATWRAMGALRRSCARALRPGAGPAGPAQERAVGAPGRRRRWPATTAQSAREAAAAWFYAAQGGRVPRNCMPWSAAAAGRRAPGLCRAHRGRPSLACRRRPRPGARAAYGVIIPNASRPEKLWPERHWVAVGRRMREAGLDPGGAVGPRGRADAGRTHRRQLRRRCAALPEGGRDGGRAGRRAARGGPGHRLHAPGGGFGRPTLGIYCDHEPGLAGITGPGRWPASAARARCLRGPM
jgi:heptosyltransferase-1